MTPEDRTQVERVALIETQMMLEAIVRTRSTNFREVNERIMANRAALSAPAEPSAALIGERKHVMPGDPPDICNIALQWYLKFDFGFPHSTRESNIAVEGFKDGYRAALSASSPATAPERCECMSKTFAEMHGGGFRCINCKRTYGVPEPLTTTATASVEVVRTLAAGRIIDIMCSGSFDWRSRLEDSDFLESADWLTALAYADAAISTPSGEDGK